MSIDMLHLVTTLFDRLALSIIYALAITALWLAPFSALNDSSRRVLLLSMMALTTFVAACVELLIRTAVLADVNLTQAINYIPKALSHSEYGLYWQWRMAVWVVMLTIILWIWRKGWLSFSSSVLLLAVLVTSLLISVTSHAGEDGLWSIANIMNWLHLVSTSIWGGTVILYALLVLPAIRNSSDTSNIVSNVAARLSTLATVALIIVLLTGIFNTWRQLGAISDLWTTDYGQILLLKLTLVTVMMFIGALNRFLLVPKLIDWHKEQGNQWGRPFSTFMQMLRLDGCIFIVVMIFAVILGTLPPPVHGTG